MILRSDLLTGPLFGTKNKARFPETYSQGLYFSVLHCGFFFLDAVYVGSLREGVALRTSASPYLDQHMILAAHAEAASSPKTCLEIFS